MKRLRYFVLLLLLPLGCTTTPENTMSGEALEALIQEVGSDVQVNNRVIQFHYQGSLLICIYDNKADRMRIISPITGLASIDGSQLAIAMAANFHTALDARYAISDGVIYSVFIHPLSSLGEEELRSAIHQVAAANQNFGSSYSSGGLVFPGSSSEPKPVEQKRLNL